MLSPFSTANVKMCLLQIKEDYQFMREIQSESDEKHDGQRWQVPIFDKRGEAHLSFPQHFYLHPIYSVDSACVVKIDREASLKNMTLLSCGVLVPSGNTADLEEGSTVVVFGLGVVGLAVVEGARVRGASRIIGVDINSDKQIRGEAIGITDFINPKDLDMPVHQGWGLTVLLGVHPSPRLLPLHPMELFDGRRIVASVFGDFKGKSQLPQFAYHCTKGVVKLEEFITHEMPFSKINDAMQLLLDGKSLRCVLHL
ncbi:hypothetical protein SASPL_130710 [Salvia splendens]|uniref:Alcohol dehydrogenase n=1 Tax=Salvia splendens TaxID=180675 RepID=A0A8X8ZKA3_SALSN|nr:hypothetical protein SASPL_130710 [Salvia splendens]